MSEFEISLDDLEGLEETQETDSSTTGRVGSLLTIDIGSVNTKAALFDMVEGRFRFLAPVPALRQPMRRCSMPVKVSESPSTR